MSETSTEQTTETAEATETETSTSSETEGSTAEVRDPQKLLSAYEAEKEKRKTGDAERRKLQEEYEALKAQVDGREAEHKAAQEAQRVKDEALAAANDRIIRSEVKAAAKGALADPADAYKFLDLSEFEVDDNGNVDEGQIAKAIETLVTEKPYLAAQGKRFQGSADGGARNDTSKPTQLSRSDLAGMTPESIDKARKAGQLADLMGGK